jgi:hypothetical protein
VTERANTLHVVFFTVEMRCSDLTNTYASHSIVRQAEQVIQAPLPLLHVVGQRQPQAMVNLLYYAHSPLRGLSYECYRTRHSLRGLAYGRHQSTQVAFFERGHHPARHVLATREGAVGHDAVSAVGVQDRVGKNPAEVEAGVAIIPATGTVVLGPDYQSVGAEAQRPGNENAVEPSIVVRVLIVRVGGLLDLHTKSSNEHIA